MLKKIDSLLLRSFIGPFVVSFGIALLVLLLQFLWLYIDEIAGKGVSIIVLLELIAYQSISFFPLALPIGVILASVMVMGNLAERYELSSLKSAGVSLMRVMASLIVVAAGIAVFSYVCSDYIMPISNLKARTRLFDIRKQKPALSIEENVFNEDFRQFVIRVGEKRKDGEIIENIMIEDQTSSNRLNMNKILADSGEMYTTGDKRFFVMNLYRGTQYQAPKAENTSQRKQNFPFVRTNFSSWEKVWDMREFDLNLTDEDRFKEQRSMLSMKQLRGNMDSLSSMMDRGKQTLADEMLLNIKRLPHKPIGTPPPKSAPAPEQVKEDINSISERMKQQALFAQQHQQGLNDRAKALVPLQKLDKALTDYPDFLSTFDTIWHTRLKAESFQKVKIFATAIESHEREVDIRKKEFVKTAYEYYTKYTFALVCFLFVFIGAPMGAIIRKGGFGYPILVSIVYFVVFVLLTIMCRKLAESYLMSPFMAAMVPCLILVPVGALLTYKANHDSPVFNFDRFSGLLDKFRKKTKA